MERGLAIIERTETGTNGIFIDQETIEQAQLNARVKKHIEEAEARAKVAYEKHRKAEKAAARRRAYNIATVKHILIDCGIIGAVTWAGLAGMAHPAICIGLGLIALCAGCVRLGEWFGRAAKK